ncbi:phage portal protein [Halomarina rubra]|uniref:Phage portal protein n=1 Tax=Halomarina rubra TaxID=2071873 RepID=A0ABD6AS29_9EURY|nr:phage portal protein [Halomarina rubra]
MASFTDILREHERRIEPREKAGETTIGGESVDLETSETVSVSDDGFLGTSTNGVPRGREAFEARELGQTAIAESIKNIIISQLTGGELAFPMEDDVEEVPDAIAELRSVFRSLLTGPHYAEDDWDDLVTAAVSDMADIGNAYWEVIGTTSQSFPVGSFKPVPALTVKHNVDKHGGFAEDGPAYYQAPVGQHGEGWSTAGATPQKLDREDLVSFRWPGSRRAGRVYPMSPMMQVREWIELIVDSTAHHGRYYSDNEMPAGFLQVMQAGDHDVQQIKSKIQAAAGDPRSVEVIGGEGPANWIEMGGTAVNLDVIEEQRWFINLVLGAFGIPKQELALVDDVNRNTSEAQASMIYRRVTRPLADAICDAVTNQVFARFDAYESLGRPFGLDITYSDPEQERAREEQLRERFTSGALPYAEYRQQLGEDPGDTTIEVNGETVDYGDVPFPLVKALIGDAHNGDDSLDEEGDRENR